MEELLESIDISTTEGLEKRVINRNVLFNWMSCK